MAGLFDKFFKKEEIVDVEKLSLAAQLSFLSIQKDTHLLAYELLEKLAYEDSFIQKALRIEQQEQLPIREELDLLALYISVYQKQKGDGFFIKADTKLDPALELRIYPFVLFPLIQNAIVHGYNSMEKFPIRIRIKQLDNTLKLEVSNRVNHYLENQEENEIIKYFKSRLQLLYPEKHSLVINSNSNVFKSTLILNLK